MVGGEEGGGREGHQVLKNGLYLEAVAPVTRLEVPVACRERSLDA